MKSNWSDIQWGKVLVAGVVAPLVSMVLLILVITVYATSLAIQARGQPNQLLIEKFANQVAGWVGPVLPILLTVGGAAWVMRKVDMGADRHGLLVGLVAAILVLIISLAFSGSLGLTALVGFVLTVASGWLGGRLSSRRSKTP